LKFLLEKETLNILLPPFVLVEKKGGKRLTVEMEQENGKDP